MKWLAVLALIPTAHAVIETKVWNNPACRTGACEVKMMKLTLDKTVSAEYAARSLIAEFETTRPEQLKKFAFVQYIRGCLFKSDANGPTKMGTREFFGVGGQPFQHKGWEIDSAGEPDPIYWSTWNIGWDELRGFEILRNANYSTIKPEGVEPEKWAGKVSNIKGRNVLYVADAPTGSMAFAGQDVSNTSLDFKICLHEIKDVPRVAESKSQIVPNPIGCLEWSSNFVYDHAARRFRERTTPHPFCLE
jgi:hypothetical protein